MHNCTVTLSTHIYRLVPISSINFKTTTHQVVQMWVQWTIIIRVKWFRFGKRSPYEDAQRMLASMDQSFNGQVRPRWPFGTCSLFIYTVNLLVRETQKSERPKYAFGELSFFCRLPHFGIKGRFSVTLLGKNRFLVGHGVTGIGRVIRLRIFCQTFSKTRSLYRGYME